MRPKIFTLRNLFLVVLALGIFGGLALWGYRGFPLPFAGVPSTAGKIAFAWEKDGQTDLYLASATGGEPTRLTNTSSQEEEVVFSQDGQHLAFTADRSLDSVRQISLTEAAPARKIITLTTTSATKELPLFSSDRDLFFLDSGKVARTTTDASDATAIFPTVQDKRDNALLGALFAEGGVARFAVANEGEIILAAVKRERGEVLAVYLKNDKTLALLGSAQKLQFQALGDGSFVVLFDSGSPLKEPITLPTPKNTEEGQAAAEQLTGLLSQLGEQTDAMEGQAFLVRFDSSFKPANAIPFPFAPTGFAIAPDNQTVGVFANEGDADKVGLFIGGLAAQEPPQRIFDKPVSAIAWSPDSSSLAFLSAGELLVTPSTGTATPLSLTNRKGRAHSLAWSPTIAKK
jgi:WD40 repeat protein